MALARVSRGGFEAVILPSSQKVRVTRGGFEAVILPTSRKMRVSRMGFEAIISLQHDHVYPAAAVGTASAPLPAIITPDWDEGIEPGDTWVRIRGS